MTLYKMNLKPQKTNKVYSNNVGDNSSQSYVTVEPAQSWETWHRCLGHVGYSGIQQMVTKGLVDGLNIRQNLIVKLVLKQNKLKNHLKRILTVRQNQESLLTLMYGESTVLRL